MTNEEKRALDRMHLDLYNEVRQAAEAHRQVMKYLAAVHCFTSDGLTCHVYGLGEEVRPRLSKTRTYND